MTSNAKESNDALSKVAALSISAEKADTETVSHGADVEKSDDTVKQVKDKSDAVPKATEQSIDPWSVEAATDEQGNTLQFDYLQISKYVK